MGPQVRILPFAGSRRNDANCWSPFTNRQFGFLKGRSVVTQLLQILDDWTEKLESGGRIDQGDHSSWKVMEFTKTIFQAWKVMENSQGHEKSWKVMENNDRRAAEAEAAGYQEQLKKLCWTYCFVTIYTNPRLSIDPR